MAWVNGPSFAAEEVKYIYFWLLTLGVGRFSKQKQNCQIFPTNKPVYTG